MGAGWRPRINPGLATHTGEPNPLCGLCPTGVIWCGGCRSGYRSRVVVYRRGHNTSPSSTQSAERDFGQAPPAQARISIRDPSHQAASGAPGASAQAQRAKLS